MVVVMVIEKTGKEETDEQEKKRWGGIGRGICLKRLQAN